jgi:hypothetical protein
MSESQPINEEIKVPDQDQPTNQDVDPENELAACLKVRSGSDSDDSAVSTKSKQRFVPKTLKTRADLIKKIKQSAVVVGNEPDIKGMRLHRRRRNSLDAILREQVAKAVQTQAEQSLGIPQEHDKRLEYAVNMLYRFDICVLKIVEKVVDYANFGMTVDGLAKTVDHDSEMKAELKDALKDFIEEGEYDWVKEAASPTTRILLCHLYPIMSVLRRSEPNRIQPAISPEMRGESAKAKLRSVFRQARPDVPRPAPRLPSVVKLV